MKNNFKNIGQLFQHERKLQRKSTKEIAEQMGIKATSINKFENGIVNMSIKKMFEYAEVLNLEIKVELERK